MALLLLFILGLVPQVAMLERIGPSASAATEARFNALAFFSSLLPPDQALRAAAFAEGKAKEAAVVCLQRELAEGQREYMQSEDAHLLLHLEVTRAAVTAMELEQVQLYTSEEGRGDTEAAEAHEQHPLLHAAALMHKESIQTSRDRLRMPSQF